MRPGTIVMVNAPARQDVGIFKEHLPYHRMARVEIIREWNGKGWVDPDKPYDYITRLKYCKQLMSRGED